MIQQTATNTPTKVTKRKKPTKLQTVANALLAGEHLTGLQLLNDYKSASYRDTIGTLRKRGMDITTIMDKHSDGRHGRYFMTNKAIEAYQSKSKHMEVA